MSTLVDKENNIYKNSEGEYYHDCTKLQGHNISYKNYRWVLPCQIININKFYEIRLSVVMKIDYCPCCGVNLSGYIFEKDMEV